MKRYMKSSQFVHLPENIKKEIGNAEMKCPYHKGKMIVSQYKKYTLEAAKALIDKLTGNSSDITSYEQLRNQCNHEKELQHSLTHDMVRDRMKVAYQYYLDTTPELKIGVRDLFTISHAPRTELSDKLEKYFRKINNHIKNNFPEVEAKGKEYDLAKRALEERGMRKTANGESHGFDSFCEKPIITQLVLNTFPYIQYLHATHSHNFSYTYDVTHANAPKFRFFSAKFGGPGGASAIRLALTNTLFTYVSGRNPEGFYDEHKKFGITQEVIQIVEEKLKDIAANHDLIEIPSSGDFFLSDENIYGCPAQDSFTKLYHLVLAAFMTE